LILILLAFTGWSLWLTSEKTDQKKEVEQAGQPLIGGDFTLTDQNGRPVRESDFRGRVMLVFFGFTHCPDECPATVATLTRTMELLGPLADQVAPIFITVDPERDTPAVLKDFLSNFDKRFVGLTGTQGQIRQVAELYKVYYAKSNGSEKAEFDLKNPDYNVD